MKTQRIALALATLCLLTLLLLALPGRAETSRDVAGPIHHVVIAWLKTPGDTEARARILEASRTLENIPGVLRVGRGVVLPSERAVVDSSFDGGFVITRADRAARAAYARRTPRHIPTTCTRPCSPRR